MTDGTTAADPVADLREAASLMRERASAASPGPWHQLCLGSEGCQVLNDGRLRDRKPVSFSGRKEWKADHADAEYIASMHPSVGLALADLLDAEAEDYETLTPDMRQFLAGGTPGTGSLDPAVAVARACLGRTGA